jgi:hypothetical protein
MKPRRRVDQQSTRFGAIRTIVRLVDDDEDLDVVAGALVVIGATPEEITAALLGADRAGAAGRR